MDVFLILETIEIVGILAYTGYTRPQHSDIRTQYFLMVHALLLGLDVFVLRRHHPDWFRDSINLYAVFTWGYCYEKIFRKYVVVILSLLGL